MLGNISALVIWGAGLIAVGVLILWRIASWDLKGVLWDTALHVIWTRGRPKTATALEEKIGEIRAEASTVGKARRVAGQVAGHFAAQVLGLLALGLILVGAVLIAAGFYWR